jgi:hypothetical protein
MQSLGTLGGGGLFAGKSLAVLGAGLLAGASVAADVVSVPSISRAQGGTTGGGPGLEIVPSPARAGTIPRSEAGHALGRRRLSRSMAGAGIETDGKAGRSS